MSLEVFLVQLFFNIQPYQFIFFVYIKQRLQVNLKVFNPIWLAGLVVTCVLAALLLLFKSVVTCVSSLLLLESISDLSATDNN